MNLADWAELWAVALSVVVAYRVGHALGEGVADERHRRIRESIRRASEKGGNR